MNYQDGIPTTELTKIYGLSKASVLAVLGEAGVHMRRQGLNEEQTAEAVRLLGSSFVARGGPPDRWVRTDERGERSAGRWHQTAGPA